MEQLNLGLEEPVKVEPKESLIDKAGNLIKERYGDKTGLERGADIGEYLLRASPLGPLASIAREAVQKPREGESNLDRIKKLIPRAAEHSLGDTAAQLYTTLNEIGMGGPDALVKAFSGLTKSSAYDKLKAFRAKHQEASDRGSIAGVVAGMMAPSGGILKAASGGAKALKAGKLASGLAKAADIASGAAKVGKGANLLSRAGGAAVRGGLAAAEQAVPRGIIQAIGTGDIGKAAKGAALGTALGAGLGGGLQVVGEGLKGLGGLASRFAQSKGLIKAPGGLKGLETGGAKALSEKADDLAFVVDPLEEKLLKDTVKGRFPELNTQTLLKGLKSYAGKLGIDKAGYVRKQGKEALESLVGISDTYGVRNLDDLQDLMDGAGAMMDNAYSKAAIAGVTPSTILAPLMDEGGDIANFAAEYGDEAADILGPIMKKVGGASDIRAAKASIDKLMRHYRKGSSFAEEGAVDLLASLKTKLDDAVVDIDPNLSKAKHLWKGLAPIKELLAREEITLPALFSGSPTAEKQALESALKGVASGTGDPAAIASAIAASYAGKKVASGIQQVGGFLKGEMADALRKPENLAMLKKGIAGVKGLAGGIGKIAGELPELAPKMAGAAPSVLERAAEAEPAVKEAITGEPAEEAQAAKASAQASEAAAAPEAVEAAKEEVKTAWADKVENNIQTAYYQYGVADMGYSYEEFLEAVREGTNNFDPTIAAEIVFDDEKERAEFLKDYDKALQYKSIDVGAALDPNAGGFMGLLGPSAGQKSSRSQLTDYIARVAGEDPMLMDAKKKKKIADTVKRISGMKGSDADKQSALLRELQANYGVDYARLADLGLLGVV